MNLQELQTKKADIKRGTFFKVRYTTIKNGLAKTTNGVFRLVEYGNINGVVKVGKVNLNEQWLEQDIVFNKNTNKTYIQLATTDIKSNSKYYNNGVEITKQEYELVNKPRNYNGEKPVVIRLDINNIEMFAE